MKLFDVGANFDFVSVRAGIQPFTSDFRGFLFRDTNLGVRLFGTWGRNRNQWNVAYFDQLEKETNSELNLFDGRNQHVVVANYYRQDFLTPGYTISPSFHANFDDGEEFFFDANGFLVRPSPVGVIQPHRVRSYYAGLRRRRALGPAERHAPVLPGARPRRASTALRAGGPTSTRSLPRRKRRSTATGGGSRAHVRVVVRRRRSGRRPRAAGSTRSSTTRTSRAGRSASGTAKGSGWLRPDCRWSGATA